MIRLRRLAPGRYRTLGGEYEIVKQDVTHIETGWPNWWNVYPADAWDDVIQQFHEGAIGERFATLRAARDYVEQLGGSQEAK